MMADFMGSCSGKVSKVSNSGVSIVYGIFATLAVLVYHMIAEREFSSLLTLSAIFQCLAFSLLVLQVFSIDSIRGISAKSLQLDALALACRLSSTTWLEGYLPNDRTGDYLYQAFDVLCLGMVLWLLHQVKTVQRKTYGVDEDLLSGAPFALVSLVLAFLLHADLNDRPLFDALWMCGLFISSVAVLPQLWMMTHTGDKIPAATSHFVAVMAFSRFLSGLYMWEAHPEISCEPWIGTFNHAGYAILAAHALHMLLLSDFAYFYLRNLTKSGLRSPLQLPDTLYV